MDRTKESDDARTETFVFAGIIRKISRLEDQAGEEDAQNEHNGNGQKAKEGVELRRRAAIWRR